jgi:hypothetical protein
MVYFPDMAHVAQLVEHVLGKDEVTRSIRVVGSIPCDREPAGLLLATGQTLQAFCATGEYLQCFEKKE